MVLFLVFLAAPATASQSFAARGESEFGYDGHRFSYDEVNKPADSLPARPIESQRLVGDEEPSLSLATTAGRGPWDTYDWSSNFVAPSGLPDQATIVRGGQSDVPGPGEVFSGAFGETVDDAAAFVPHGSIRATTVGDIRAAGETVDVVPELTRSGVLNDRHVNICLGSGPCPFPDDFIPNPVPKAGRIQ